MGSLIIEKVKYSGDKYFYESPMLTNGINLIVGDNGGYFGVMVPPVSVKPCHFERYCNYIKFYCYSFFKAPFLKDSPLRSILWEEFTIRSRIASAMVPSPMMSYQAETGIWDKMMVEDRL